MSDTNSPNPTKGSGPLNDIATLLGDMASNSFDLATGKFRAKSIAERARRSILMYKVGVSTSVEDLDLSSNIAKYLETMYAIFTMINLGYCPFSDSNDDIRKVIDSVSAESFNPLNAMNSDVNRSLAIAMKDYAPPKIKKGSRLGRNASAESDGWDGMSEFLDRWNSGDLPIPVDEMNKDDAKMFIELAKSMNESRLNNEKVLSEVAKREAEAERKENEAKLKELWNKYNLDESYNAKYSKNFTLDDASVKVRQDAFIKKLDANDIKAVPTIVSLKTKYGEIPLAVKANLYGIAAEEVKSIVESALSGKAYSFLRFVKWRSGEISTLAWLFNTDLADKDKKLYKSLGKNPWYIDLMKRRAAAKRVSFAKFAVNSIKDDAKYGSNVSKDYLKEVKTDINTMKDLPPTGSLIITKNDLLTATNLDISHFMKNEKLLKSIMKNLYLLCLGIVDPDTESVQFFFDGYTYPFLVKFNDLKKGKDPNQSLYDTMKELAKRS